MAILRYLIVIILPLLSLKGFASSVVIAVTNNSITIAADTKSVFYNNGIIQKSETLSKIFQHNNFVYGATGCVDFPMGLKIEDELAKAVKQFHGSRFSYREFEKALKPLLLEEIAKIKGKEDNGYMPFLKNGGLLFNCYVVGFDKNIPYITLLSLSLKTIDPLELESEISSLSCLEVGDIPKFFTLGERKAVKQYIDSPPEGFQSLTLAENLELMIIKQAELTPETVGIPVEVVELKSNTSRVNWIRKLLAK